MADEAAAGQGGSDADTVWSATVRPTAAWAVRTAGLVRAAGALVRRAAAGGDELALIHRIKYGDWTFPKGKLEPGEHVLEAAVREVAEETGVRVVLGRRLTPVSYDIDGRLKRVDYWAARSAPGASTRFVPNSEVDELMWLPMAAAPGKLSYDHDAALLAELAAGPPDTVPVILLRHASAGTKDSWPGEDLDRPLDAAGAAVAERLAGLLSCFGSCRVISSPAERCLATVRPYARRAGTQIAVEAALTVAGSPPDPAAVRQVAAAIVAERQPTVLCAHRENLSPALAAICGYLGADLPGRPDGPELRKGGFWVLHTAGRILASAELYGPRPNEPG